MRRAKRCPHGFHYAWSCRECNALSSAIYRANRIVAAKARGSLLRNVLTCATCGQLGHVSKLCPSTAVGRERIARAG